MERYDSYEEYYNAKLTIFQNQKADDYILLDSEILPVESSADIIEIKALQGFDFSSSKLTGTHMYKNLYVVYKIMNILNIKNSKKLMQEFIKQFSGVQFRLEFIKSVQKTDFYNDAKSTNTASTIAAIESFPNKKVALILGGKLRDDTQDFLSPLKENQSITLYLFGDSREYLRQQLGNDFKIVMAEKLDDLLELSDLSEFEVVLFSPGFPSFDQYKNYIARGDHFNSIVNNLL
jgi:UDP-N-acetylmuramoylalanine--D-glutamate ligase